MNDVTELRLRLLENGYPIIAVNGKVPEFRDWQNTRATPEAVSRWPANNTGVLTATMPSLDLDVLDPEAADALEEAVREWIADRGTLLVRFGNAPKRAIPFRTTTPFAKVTRNLVDAHGKVHRVELLGSGQQIVVHGPHAETKRPYSWAANRSPATVPYNDLPPIDGAEALQLVDYLVTMLVEQFGFTEGTAPTDHAGANGSAAHVPLEERIENMEYSGVYPYNDTLLAMTMDRLDCGIPVEDVIEEGLELVRRNAPERNKDGKVWDWNMLRKQLGRMCYGHINKKHGGRPQLIDCLPDLIRARWRAREAAGETNIKVWWSGVNGGSWCVRGQAAHDTQSAAGTTNTAAARSADGDGVGGCTSAGPKKYRFPLIAFNDMRPGDEQSYLVEELFPTVGLALVYGAPKSGKSFWVFDVMMHVTLNWEYRDRVVQHGPVVYCAFEGAHGYRKRSEAFRRHHGLTDEKPLMFIVPGRADLIKDHQGLIADMRAQLADTGVAQPPKAVVLDTLNKSLIGSESKDVDMANYIAAAEAIQKAFGCLVIIVHHHGIEESRPRGHTSLRGAIDVMIKITRDEQNNIIAVVEEMRDGPEGAQIASRLVVIEVGQEANGKPKTSAAVEPTDASSARRPTDLSPNQRTMFALLEEAGPGGLTAKTWDARARGAGLGKHRKATLVDLRTALRRKNLVVERNGLWVVMSDHSRDL